MRCNENWWKARVRSSIIALLTSKFSLVFDLCSQLMISIRIFVFAFTIQCCACSVSYASTFYRKISWAIAKCSENFVSRLILLLQLFSLFPFIFFFPLTSRRPRKCNIDCARLKKTIEAEEEWKKCKERSIFTSCQNIVWTPVHFTTRFLKHHKGVALNGENIWRLPKPGYHIGTARCQNFLIWLYYDGAQTPVSVRFSKRHIQGCCFVSMFWWNFLSWNFRACSKNLLLGLGSEFSRQRQFSNTHERISLKWILLSMLSHFWLPVKSKGNLYLLWGLRNMNKKSLLI